MLSSSYHRKVFVFYAANPSDLVVVSEGMKPNERRWIYIAMRRGFLHPLKVRLVKNMFMTKFKELTMTRF